MDPFKGTQIKPQNTETGPEGTERTFAQRGLRFASQEEMIPGASRREHFKGFFRGSFKGSFKGSYHGSIRDL